MTPTSNPTSPAYSIIEFVQIVLRNISQVVMQNNWVSGAVILAGIFYQSADFGIATLSGSIVSTLTAMFLKTNRDQVAAGLYGFNGVLTAIAIVFYCETAFDAIDISWWMISAYVFLGAVFSTVLTAAIGAMLSGSNVPPLTAPFVLASWLFVAGTHFSPALSPGHNNPIQPKSPVSNQASTDEFANDQDDDDKVHDEDDRYDIDTWWEGTGKGFGEIFLQDNAVSGYLILLAIAINSRISAFMAAIGALISIGVAELLHVGEFDIQMGMFSYSAILTAIAIGGLFYLLDWRGFVYMIFGVVMTTWLYAALAAILLPLHLPPYTAPFVLVTWVLLFSKTAFHGLTAIPPAEATTPEENWKRYRQAKS